MQTEASVEIDRPVQEVFDLTLDDVSKWSTIVVEDETLEEKPGMVGTTFRTVTEDHGRRDEFEGVVTKHEPPHSHAIEMTGKSFDLQVDYRFEDLGGRTRVTQDSNVTPKGFFKVMCFFLGWLMKKSGCDAVQRELNNLKAFCESQPAPAGQDGIPETESV